jgi:hypothetical protein
MLMGKAQLLFGNGGNQRGTVGIDMMTNWLQNLRQDGLSPDPAKGVISWTSQLAYSLK